MSKVEKLKVEVSEKEAVTKVETKEIPSNKL